MISSPCLGMIFSENRLPFLRIMLWEDGLNSRSPARAPELIWSLALTETSHFRQFITWMRYWV